MRLLIVAAPLISRGGVYSWLRDATPILRADGWTVGVAWMARVPADAPPADWELRLDETPSRLGRAWTLRRQVADAVRAFRPDCVLSLLPQSDLACAQAARAAAPWVAMAHGRPYPAAGEGSSARRIAWRGSVRWAYRRADRVVAVSHALGEQLRADLAVRSVTTIHNGVHLPPAAQLRERAGRTVGFLGRLSVEKAPDVFVQAVRDVPCRARVFGDGPLLDEVRAEAAELQHVSFEGWTDRASALDAIDLLVLCSRREALPLACIEAGAHGIPVIARDVGGVAEVLGVDPLLREHCVLPADASPEAFGQRIARLLDDVALRRRLGARLRETVAERFALPGQALQLGRLLEMSARVSVTVSRQRR
ncbi:MAG TPA: glycosyltransferase family 4 protein [Conexibacter sp.]|nr:glycosyltransferase family 4 protein [Conexibacter sp.]